MRSNNGLNKWRKTLNNNFLFIRNSIERIKCDQPTLIICPIDTKKTSILIRRYHFYFPDNPVKKKSLLKGLLSRDILLVYGYNPLFIKILSILRRGIYNIDYEQNPFDVWKWNKAIYYYMYKLNDPSSKIRFQHYITELLKNNYNKCYIFGTGPSLEKARNRIWNDGYRIACNTIVKDKELWNHINPHIVVAADALYHFSDSKHAKLFRSDLKKRLGETDTVFMYPSLFHPIVIREFSNFTEKLIPIPENGPDFFYSLLDDFRIPSSLGNIISIMLIPIACTLSKNIFLWGFDGRSPDDSFFWKNSDKQSYSDEIPKLKEEHPAFFRFLVPSESPNLYVNRVHGDQLEHNLDLLEMQGYDITMLHESWTPTFQKRYCPDNLSN